MTARKACKEEISLLERSKPIGTQCKVNWSVDVFRDWQAARQKKFPLVSRAGECVQDYDVHRVRNTWGRVDMEFPSIRLFNTVNYLSAYLQAAMFYSVYYIHILMATFFMIFRRFPNTFRRFPRKNR